MYGILNKILFNQKKQFVQMDSVFRPHNLDT